MNLTTKQAATRLGCAPHTLAKWRLDGSGPRFMKLGRAVRYSEDALQNWMRERERRSTADQGAVSHAT